MPDTTDAPPADDPQTAPLNEVRLRGRVSVEPESRELPSGDRLVTLRLVVDRPRRPDDTGRRVDVIDVACWTRRTQRTAGRLRPGDVVEVEGALRRRFFAAGGARTSRYEVEASGLTRTARVSRARAASSSAAG
ncbi:single-stranded DNA-binding protein [Nocardioides marmoraquaticus]